MNPVGAGCVLLGDPYQETPLTSLRSRLSYANVMSTIAVVLTLGGATAMAAVVLGPNSVGTRQLKKDAVTAAKIKDGAVGSDQIGAGAVGNTQLSDGGVSTGKLADGGVTTSKLADGSVTANKIDPAALPRGSAQIVATLRGRQPVVFPTTSEPTVFYPLENPTFTQPAGEDDLLIAAITARFASTCQPPRAFTGALVEDNPASLGDVRVLGEFKGEDHEGTGEVTTTAQVGSSFQFGGTSLLAPTSPTSRKLTFRLNKISCGTGSPLGASAVVLGAQVDVIGIR